MHEITCPQCPAAAPAAADAKSPDANWPGIVSLAFGVFGLVTAEFLPASLLTAMSADRGRRCDRRAVDPGAHAQPGPPGRHAHADRAFGSFQRAGGHGFQPRRVA